MYWHFGHFIVGPDRAQRVSGRGVARRTRAAAAGCAARSSSACARSGSPGRMPSSAASASRRRPLPDQARARASDTSDADGTGKRLRHRPDGAAAAGAVACTSHRRRRAIITARRWPADREHEQQRRGATPAPPGPRALAARPPAPVPRDGGRESARASATAALDGRGRRRQAIQAIEQRHRFLGRRAALDRRRQQPARVRRCRRARSAAAPVCSSSSPSRWRSAIAPRARSM